MNTSELFKKDCLYFSYICYYWSKDMAVFLLLEVENNTD